MDPLTLQLIESMKTSRGRADSLGADVRGRMEAAGGRDAVARRGRQRRILEQDYGADMKQRVETLFETGAPFQHVAAYMSPMKQKEYTDALLGRLLNAGRNWDPGQPQTNVRQHSNAVLDSLDGVSR